MSARQNRTRLGEAEAEQAGIAAGQSQEDAYWSRRQRELAPQFPANGGTSPTQQAPTPAPPPSQNPSMDQRRALERAQAQFSEGDSSSGLPMNVLGMQGM